MLILFALTVYVALLWIMSPQGNLTDTNKRNYLIAAGFVIVLVMGLRAENVGTRDTEMYCNAFKGLRYYDSFISYYNRVLSDSGFLSSECGFFFCVWVLTRLSANPQILIFASSAFMIFAVCKFIYKNSKDVSFSLLMYITLGLFSFNINGMRQSLAMSICLLSYEFVKNRKIVPFAITIFIAMLFHKTAFVFGIVYFLPMLKKRSYASIYMIGVIAFFAVSSRLIEAYDSMMGEDYALATTVESGGLFTILVYASVCIMTLMVWKKMKDVNIKSNFYGTLTGFILFVSRYISNAMMERISWYFFYFIILLLPNALEELNAEERRLLKMLFGAFAVMLFMYRVYGGQFRYFHFCF